MDSEDLFSDSEEFGGLSKQEGESVANPSVTVVGVSTRSRLDLGPDLDKRLQERRTCSEVNRVGGASLGFGPRLTRGTALEEWTVVLHLELKTNFQRLLRNQFFFYFSTINSKFVVT